MKKKDENMFGWNDTIRKLTEETPAHLPLHKSPPTVKDVLLKKLREDEALLADSLIRHNDYSDIWIVSDIYSKSTAQYEDYESALKAVRAYLNSAAEGATK